MGGQTYKPPETAEEKEARRMKREAEAQSRADWRWGNYCRENVTGTSNTRVVDWSKL